MHLSEPYCLDAFFLNIIKPRRMTSAKVVSTIKRAGKFRRVGHAGTLDPLADGVLPVAVGGATRMISFLHSFTKSYVAVIMFGISTTTDDLEGSPVEPSPVMPSPGRIRRELQRMVGVGMQTPPSYSAVRTAGKRAYVIARSGATPELAERKVRIVSARLLSLDFWRAGDLKLAGLDWTLVESGGSSRGRLVAAIEIECGTGTYIRSIARDLGNVLGVGACVAGLTRTRVGPFCLLQACSLGDAVHSIENGFVGQIAYTADLAALESNGLVLGSGLVSRFVQGSAVDVNGATGPNRIYDSVGRFLGMGELAQDRRLRPKIVLHPPAGRPA